MSFTARTDAYRERLEGLLDQWLPPADAVPRKLNQALRYATLGGGKRVRPLLVWFTGEVLGIEAAELDAPACAIELIHAYSLVHDDLPAMDDDDLRRGRPTCHRAFDEATAILAGDALQVLAFEILAGGHCAQIDQDGSKVRLSMIRELASASGPAGMAGGQAIDLDAAGHSLNREEVEHMHRLKTGALIRASVMLAVCARPDLDPGLAQNLRRFAECAGLAFQIQDDILDVVGETDTIGKARGADEAHNKPNFPSVVGLEEARRRAQELYHASLQELAPFGDSAEPLRRLSAYIVERRR